VTSDAGIEALPDGLAGEARHGRAEWSRGCWIGLHSGPNRCIADPDDAAGKPRDGRRRRLCGV